MRHLTSLLAGLVLVAACDSRPNRAPPQRPAEGFKSDSKTFLMNAEDFDLATVLEMVKANSVSNAEEMEAAINGDSAINNVDIDGDGQIDYVFVKEGEQTEAGSTLEFWAVPSKSQNADEAQLIATTSFSKNAQTNETTVSGGYPDYVGGYDSHYYSYNMPHRQGMTMGQAMFLMWAFDRHRPMYYRPYSRSYYHPRPIYGRSALSSRRTSYRSTKKITTTSVQKKARPASYSKQPSVTKAKSKYSSSKYNTPKHKSSSLSSRKGQSTTFKKRDTAKPKKAATGFGGKKAAKPTTKPKSSGWFGSSGSSPKKKSSGWGSSGSSGSKPRSKPSRSKPSRSRSRRR